MYSEGLFPHGRPLRIIELDARPQSVNGLRGHRRSRELAVESGLSLVTGARPCGRLLT